MRFSEAWLRELVDPKCSLEELVERLTMAGLELNSLEPVVVEGDGSSQRDDYAIELDITPNRGDCLSVNGVARDVAALYDCPYKPTEITTVAASIDSTLSVILESAACPHYVGRVINNIDLTRPTPLWLSERLRLSGLNSIDPVVDVTNYVLLELGQPMHAFDCAKLSGDIIVRQATVKESLTLLDGKTVTLTPKNLVIADQQQAIALAGIMGGEATAISTNTQNIFLESAFFAPEAIAGKARDFGMQTDSSYRFERGVDTALQIVAIERATQLLLEIVGGEAGPIIEATRADDMPQPRTVNLRPERVKRLLGIELDAKTIENFLKRLGMALEKNDTAWKVQVPVFRFDISIEADLIEEVARIYGYDNIPTHTASARLALATRKETILEPETWCQRLRAKGFSEVINYAFVDPNLQKLLFPNHASLPIINPISQDLSQMRVSLWPGLVNAVRLNQHHQQQRVRLYEMGLGFQLLGKKNDLQQRPLLAAIVSGDALPEQWSAPPKEVDFYDLKADLTALLSDLQAADTIRFEPAEHSALHPGQTAKITYQQQPVGWIGALDPGILQQLDIKGRVFVFELDLDALPELRLPAYQGFAKFPSLRRDLSFVVDNTVAAQAIIDTVEAVDTEILQLVSIFDIFTGNDVPNGKKSMAIKCVLQHRDHTLTDVEVDTCMSQIMQQLQHSHDITLRK